MKTNERCILMIKMFTGEYLTQDQNIGHEIVNIFRADNDMHYIYAPWSGLLGRNKDGKVTDILLVQNIGNNKLQVLARINNISADQHIAQRAKLTDEEVRKNIAEYAKDRHVAYNNMPISSVFTNNTYKNKPDISAAYFTFEIPSEQFRKPLQPIYLTTNKGKYLLQNTKIRQLAYYTPANGKDFRTLSLLIDNKKLWEDEDTSTSVSQNIHASRRTFLTLCRKEYDELVFSNLIAYYLENNPDLFEDFVRSVLKLNIPAPFKIKREYKHIDILIKNANSAIIIENKIKSGINGVSADKKHSQLDEYVKTLQNEQKWANIYGFVLCPQYNRIKIADYQNKENQQFMKSYYSNGVENIITYAKLFEFFSKYVMEDVYYPDFLKALSLHASDHDTYLEDLMLDRFIKMTTK